MRIRFLSNSRASFCSLVSVLALIATLSRATANDCLPAGTPVTVTAQLNQDPAQSAVVVSDQRDTSNLGFSWIIPADSFNINCNIYERFNLRLDGASTFTGTDVLNIDYELPANFTIIEAAITKGIPDITGYVQGQHLGFSVGGLDSISTVDGFTGIGADIELTAKVQPLNTPPQVTCIDPPAVECGPVTEQVTVTDPDAGQTLTLILKEGDVELDRQTVSAPADHVMVKFNPISFAPGSHLLAVLVSDGVTTSTCNSTVTVTYGWSRVLQPINIDGSSVFKAGTTVPVKFLLTGACAGISDLSATLSFAKINNYVSSAINEAISTSSATSGNLFRYDPSSAQYIFNWSTKNLTTGTYQLLIDFGDGVPRTVGLGLR
jgi:hypothetical protein